MDKFHQLPRLQVNTAKCKDFFMHYNMVALCETIMLLVRYLGVPQKLKEYLLNVEIIGSI